MNEMDKIASILQIATALSPAVAAIIAIAMADDSMSEEKRRELKSQIIAADDALQQLISAMPD